MPGACVSLEEREEIARGIASGRSLTGVARGAGRPVATVAREVMRNGDRRRYPAVVAERATRRRACRPKARRLVVDQELALEFERRLRLRHSPLETREPVAPAASGCAALVGVPRDDFIGALPAGPWRPAGACTVRCAPVKRAVVARAQTPAGEPREAQGHGVDLRAACGGCGACGPRQLRMRPDPRPWRQVSDRDDRGAHDQDHAAHAAPD